MMDDPQRRDEIRERKLDALRKEIEEGIRASEEGRVKDGRKIMASMKDRLLRRKKS